MQSSRNEYIYTPDLLLLPFLSTSCTVMPPSVFMAEGPVLAPASRASQSLDSSSNSGRKAAWNAKMYQDLQQLQACMPGCCCEALYRTSHFLRLYGFLLCTRLKLTTAEAALACTLQVPAELDHKAKRLPP